MTTLPTIPLVSDTPSPFMAWYKAWMRWLMQYAHRHCCVMLRNAVSCISKAKFICVYTSSVECTAVLSVRKAADTICADDKVDHFMHGHYGINQSLSLWSIVR